MRLIHYTIGTKIESILQDGFIATSPKKPAYGEIPLVWLSTNEEYEMTARKVARASNGEDILLSVAQMEEHGSGIYRFVFEVEPTENKLFQDWQYIRNKCGVSSALRRRLIERARNVGADENEWWGHINKPLPVVDAKLERRVEDDNGNVIWVPIEVDGLKVKTKGYPSMTVEEMAQHGFQMDLDSTWKNG